MWEKIAQYIKNKRVLEIGCGEGQKTHLIAKYASEVMAIDISEENIKIARDKYIQDTKIYFEVADASNLRFDDKSFDVVITTDSFHEINPEIQSRVLYELTRISDVIIFIEPDCISVTNELFKVFDENENHSLRISNSIDKVFKYMEEKNYKMIDNYDYDDKTKFLTIDDMCETLLDWWSDIKVPKNLWEKEKMIKEIKLILDNFNMLEKLEVIEKIHAYIFVKE